MGRRRRGRPIVTNMDAVYVLSTLVNIYIRIHEIDVPAAVSETKGSRDLKRRQNDIKVCRKLSVKKKFIG
jgi:hypothetical protein